MLDHARLKESRAGRIDPAAVCDDSGANSKGRLYVFSQRSDGFRDRTLTLACRDKFWRSRKQT